MPYGLYVHIPYCRSRCRYCDFYTAPAARGVPDAYIDAVERDLARYAPKQPDGAPRRPDTLYFGGGTPGLLSPPQVARLVRAANPLPGAEITLEANPESAGEEVLAGFLQAGVNRLSLGVQTARNESLRTLGRLHSVEAARRALAAARQAGFTNISGDIMLALPGYTRAQFDETLALLAGGGVTHISAYLLKLEQGTPLAQNPPPGLPTEDEAAAFYLYAVQRLAAAGYAQYEISNFARPGFAGRHNLLYWNCEDYLGLGPAAHSCIGGRRFSFPADTAAFLAGHAQPADEGTCGAEDYIMLRLRLAAGLAEEELRRRYGTGLSGAQRATLEELARAGLARPIPGGWALTPRGMLVQSAILARLL